MIIAVNTETYHAQYRVLEAFSFFNVILSMSLCLFSHGIVLILPAVFAFMIMLLVLAIRHHRWGNNHVWLYSVTAFPWFAGPDAQTGKLLPAPVSAKRSASRAQRPREAGGAREVPATREERGRSEKRPSQRRPPAMRHSSPTRNEAPTYVYWIPHTPPEKAHVPDQAHSRQPRDKFHRDASPRR